jgi:death-on-curing protein
LFLELNGHELTAGDPACVATILALAAGELTERELATWVRDNSRGHSRVEP